MPDLSRQIVIDTSPLLALCAACGDFAVLRYVYEKAIVPYEVAKEIMDGGSSGFACAEFQADQWLEKIALPIAIAPFLQNAVDAGEAAVIQLALNLGIHRVAIDDRNGRRVACTCGLSVTGSLGILIKAKTMGYPVTLQEATSRMRVRGIWLADKVVREAMHLAGEESS